MDLLDFIAGLEDAGSHFEMRRHGWTRAARLQGNTILARDGVDAFPVAAFGGLDLQPQFLAESVGERKPLQ